MTKENWIFISISFVAVFAFTLVLGGFTIGSNQNQTSVVVSGTDKPIVVLSTFTVISDMVREVGGSRVEAISLTKPGTEIHGYEPTPGDLVRASKAQIIFDNGLNLEVWAEKLYNSIPDVPHVTLTDGIDVISIAEGAYQDRPNPHAWMSPKQALIYVENIKNALNELSPADANYFGEQADAYAAKITELDTRLAQTLATLPESNRYLVTCEGAFTYLTNDYNLTEVYLWAINDESQGSPRQIASVIETVKKKNIPTVFCESTIDPRIQTEVVHATNATLGGVLYVDSLSNSEGPASTYLKLLEYTVTTIITGLSLDAI